MMKKINELVHIVHIIVTYIWKIIVWIKNTIVSILHTAIPDNVPVVTIKNPVVVSNTVPVASATTTAVSTTTIVS
jgi:hypothetical protein